MEIAHLAPELRHLGRANKLSNPIRILGPCGGRKALDSYICGNYPGFSVSTKVVEVSPVYNPYIAWGLSHLCELRPDPLLLLVTTAV